MRTQVRLRCEYGSTPVKIVATHRPIPRPPQDIAMMPPTDSHLWRRAKQRLVSPILTPPESKAFRVGPLIAFETPGGPVWSPLDYAAFSREGYMVNAIVYRCVRMICEAAASVPLCVYDGPTELEDHPLLDLLARPSPHSTRTELFESLLVSGNSYVEAVALNGQVRELYTLRPDRITNIPGNTGWPEGYQFTAAGGQVIFADDIRPVHAEHDRQGVRPILHLRLFHPLDDHYGLSPIEAMPMRSAPAEAG